tara:strand:+ start:955 stop:1764 length:810 start_codon:yes stop_codon:yes gene_type:complete
MIWYEGQAIFGEIVYKKLKWSDELLLIEKAQAGDRKAMDMLVRSKVLLVLKLAIDEFGKVHRGVPVEDLIAEGCLGVIEAVKRFDASKGFLLSSYCKPWVQSYFQASFKKQSRVVSYPAQIINNHSKIYKSLCKLERNQKEVTINDIVEDTGLTENTINGMFSFVNWNKSFDSVDGLGRQMYEYHHDERSMKDFDRFEMADIVEKYVFSETTDSQKKWLHHYYYENLTHREIGEIYGVERRAVERRFAYLAKKLNKIHDRFEIMKLVED